MSDAEIYKYKGYLIEVAGAKEGRSHKYVVYLDGREVDDFESLDDAKRHIDEWKSGGSLMNNGYSRSQQRREAARKYAVQCMNARGEVECSECGAGVDEARGNRNAQELDREKIRKSSKGPICNACQASWRYSHHQEPEMANAEPDNGWSDTDVHAMAQEMFKDSWDNLSSKEQDQVYEALEKEMKNAASHTDTCDFCGKDYQCNRIKHDVLKCPDCGGPSTMIKNAYGCGICGEKGHVYDVDGDKKILCEKHAKESGGVFLSNDQSDKSDTTFVCDGCGEKKPASELSRSKGGSNYCYACDEARKNSDNAKCSRCGAKVGAMGVDHGNDVYCVDCAVEKGYIDKKDVA